MDAEQRLDAAVGSVAEEAARLLEALGRPPAAQRDAPSGSDGGTTSTGSTTAHDPTQGGTEHVHVAMGDAQTCTWCPVCRSVGVLRGVSPETLTRLADLATAAATVLADLATRHPNGAGERREPAERGTRTEPITVVDEEELS
ncbi:hypothetical protein [Knoellia aerolata]|uniref:Uncharacterized protein n=1 Tax=Knoellia aerolata DSM 18566 TaxID=1385519 RepID=A0A0A0JV75_9MICO|nr:hypothetical protein [Knoellia aerolata]KGN41068.1 hypothetical protein N801_09370 [Knoellia aerolata DSM 18566]